jgi:hypothetical protein
VRHFVHRSLGGHIKTQQEFLHQFASAAAAIDDETPISAWTTTIAEMVSLS